VPANVRLVSSANRALPTRLHAPLGAMVQQEACDMHQSAPVVRQGRTTHSLHRLSPSRMVCRVGLALAAPGALRPQVIQKHARRGFQAGHPAWPAEIVQVHAPRGTAAPQEVQGPYRAHVGDGQTLLAWLAPTNAKRVPWALAASREAWRQTLAGRAPLLTYLGQGNARAVRVASTSPKNALRRVSSVLMETTVQWVRVNLLR
jgi:hypothetical protein